MYVQDQKALHVVEQSITIPLLMSAVATTRRGNRKVPPAVDTRITTQASKNVVIAPQMADITSFKDPRTVNDTISTINGHGHLSSL
jgi:hypothetical protein